MTDKLMCACCVLYDVLVCIVMYFIVFIECTVQCTINKALTCPLSQNTTAHPLS